MTPDPSVWRVLPEPGPLAGPAGSGVLDGETVAVKDLFAVAGQRVGAGNPDWLAAAPVQGAHAHAVARLLEAGAAVTGIARTEEFAYSLTGANAHHGTPPNPRAPGRISGGSTSGPATAVASGRVSVGLGTDTGGSIRVPAAYQGLWGLRPTHGAVPVDGLLPMAPTFDTVGWLARDAATLTRVGEVLLPPDAVAHDGTGTSTGTSTGTGTGTGTRTGTGTSTGGGEPGGGEAGPGPLGPLVVSDALLELATPPVRDAVARFAHDAGALPADRAPEPAWLAAFQTLQAAEVWQAHGAWLASRMDTLGPAVRARFERARLVGPEEAAAARAAVLRARGELRQRLGRRVLVLPSAASVAPLPEDAEATREATLLLTCFAGIGGLPAVSVPVPTSEGLPAGACLVGPAGTDRALLRRAAEWAVASQAGRRT